MAIAQPVVYASRIDRDFAPDGTLNDGHWKAAEPVYIVENTENGQDVAHLKTSVRALWSEKYLYLGYQAPYTQLTTFDNDGKGQQRVGLWEKDVLEAFISLDGSAEPKTYAEFEWAPNGDCIDVGVQLPEKDMDYDSKNEFKVHIDESNKRWAVEARIPLPLKVVNATSPTPKTGDSWRINLFRFDFANDAYLAWSPTMVTPAAFHVPEKFGSLVFK